MDRIDKLKVVYVLVSNDQDFFCEQLLISILSLRHRMSDVYICLLTEEKTHKTLVGNRKEVLSLVDDVNIQQLSDNYSMAEKSRILKTMMRDVIEGDFLYIDCDTVICDSLQCITRIEKTSAVLDNHQKVNESIYEFASAINNAKKMGYSVGYHNMHYNGGILWCKDNTETRNFFKTWNQLWFEGNKKNILADQMSLNECNFRMNGFIHELEGVWNCQLRFGIPYLADAKIIHYFASNFNKYNERKFGYLLTDCEYFQQMKNGEIPDKVKDIINNPKAAFNYSIIIDVENPDYLIISSNIGKFQRYIFRKHNFLFSKIDKVLGVLNKWR